MPEQATIPCPICAEPLRFTVTTNRNGKHAIGVHCPQDGRHFRGFINHRPFVEGALDRLLAAQAEAERPALSPGGAASGPTPTDPALQKTSGGPAPRRAGPRRRPA